MRGYNKNGFTLVEVVVAVAVASVIGYFVVSFTISLTKVWRANQKNVGTEMEANLALDALAADLEAAVMFEPGKGEVMFAVRALSKAERGTQESREWHSVKSGNTQRLVENNFIPEEHIYGWAGSWLRFYTAAPSLNAVAYQIVRRPLYYDDKEVKYGLFRSIVRQDYTDIVGLDITAENYISVNYEDDEFTDDETKPIIIKKPHLQNLLSENVIDFGVRLYVFDEEAAPSEHNSAGLRLVYPAALGELDQTDIEHVAFTFERSNLQDVYPDVAEIFVRVLDAEGALLLEKAENGELEGVTFEEVAEKHGHLFRRMVTVGVGRRK